MRTQADAHATALWSADSCGSAWFTFIRRRETKNCIGEVCHVDDNDDECDNECDEDVDEHAAAGAHIDNDELMMMLQTT